MGEPQKLTLETVYDRLQQFSNDIYFGKGGLVSVAGDVRAVRTMMETSNPYLIEDYRCIFVYSGHARVVVNLKEYEVRGKTMAYITPGSIIEPRDVSDDVRIYGLGMSQEVFHLALNNKIPESFNGQNKEGVQTVESQADVELLSTLFETLLKVSRTESASDDVQLCIVGAIINFYNDMFKRTLSLELRQQTAANDIFDRFIYLVN